MTNYRYAYCTEAELLADLGLNGFIDSILDRFIDPATQYILQEIGQFIPTSEKRVFAGNNKTVLYVDPILSVTSILNGDTPLISTDYMLEPANGMWQNGPYTRLNVDLDESRAGVWIPEVDGVEIAGLWGLYNRMVDTEAVIGTTQLVTDNTLTVNDGSLVCPGMVLSIEGECQMVTRRKSADVATTLLLDAGVSDDVLYVVSSTGLNVGEIIKIGYEIIKIVDKQTGSLQVIRGWGGSPKSTHALSMNVEVYRTFTVERAVNGTLAAGHVNSTMISRYVAPSDVNYLCRQIAALMLMKSRTGYAGRAGSPETGETFYNHEFPRDVIARIKSNYFIPGTR